MPAHGPCPDTGLAFDLVAGIYMPGKPCRLPARRARHEQLAICAASRRKGRGKIIEDARFLRQPAIVMMCKNIQRNKLLNIAMIPFSSTETRKHTQLTKPTKQLAGLLLKSSGCRYVRVCDFCLKIWNAPRFSYWEPHLCTGNAPRDWGIHVYAGYWATASIRAQVRLQWAPRFMKTIPCRNQT
jgi:hypothetical protein